MQIASTQDRELKLIRALVFGDSGIGKTTSLATLPEKNTLIVLRERGTLPLRAKAFRVAVIDEWADLRELVVALRKGRPSTDGSITATIAGQEIAGIKIVAVDSLTEINSLCKRQIIEVDRKALVSKRTAGRSEKQGGPTDTPDGIYDEQMTQEDWGILASRMDGFTSAMNHLPVHTIFTSLAMFKDDKRTGETMRMPALQGSFANTCNAHFDLVMHMEAATDDAGKPTRVWRTANDGLYRCKDSTGILPEFVTANWMTVIGTILGAKSEKGEEKPKPKVLTKEKSDAVTE
jgi:hypothetical protein